VNRFAGVSEVRLKRVGTVDQVAQHLRAMIANGQLSQGDKLPEIPLSEALGVSRNTLRDALRVLGAEGLVQHQLHRGVVVRKLSTRDVVDVYAVRRMLEIEGLRALQDAPVAARSHLRETLGQLEAALAAEDYTMFAEHELSFHGAIVALLGSERFDRVFSQVLAEVRLLFGGLTENNAPVPGRKLVSRYRSIVQAAETGEIDQAVELLRDHLDRYERRLLASIIP
jgi:DNA-binding GntR family transcriptional regulator